MKNWPIRKKINFAIIVFIGFIIVTSILYAAFNPNGSTNKGNPGGTGGDYQPQNSINITNEEVFYKYLGSASTGEVEPYIKDAVLYNTSITNDSSLGKLYTQYSNFDPTQAAYLHPGRYYNVNIINDTPISIDHTPWDYRFTLSSDDGRTYRLDAYVDPNSDQHTITVTTQ